LDTEFTRGYPEFHRDFSGVLLSFSGVLRVKSFRRIGHRSYQRMRGVTQRFLRGSLVLLGVLRVKSFRMIGHRVYQRMPRVSMRFLRGSLVLLWGSQGKIL